MPIGVAVSALPIATEDRSGYQRVGFRHWNTGEIPADGCNTRAEVLIAEAIVAPEAGPRLHPDRGFVVVLLRRTWAPWRPQLLILGRHDHAGLFRTIGRTVALRPEMSRQVGEHLTAADPGHPWEGVQSAAAWGSRDGLDAVPVRPDLVAEVSADKAVDRGGVFRQPLRFQLLRLHVMVEDVPRVRHSRGKRGYCCVP